ncbi:MAG: Hypothetical protein AJITA_01032 [Acetilactobacillus jinshanensis]
MWSFNPKAFLFRGNFAVYVTGSIACYKTLKLIRKLKRCGANVKVVMSNGAQRFINPLTFKAISGIPLFGTKTWGIPLTEFPTLI